MSSQNTQPKSFLDTDSTSGAGFAALCDYLDYAGPELEWVITENVRNMCFQRSKFGGEVPIQLQDEAMKSRGFIPAHSLVNTMNYGLPQSRTRCYGLYIRATCAKRAEPTVVFKGMMRQAVSLDMALLPADTPVPLPAGKQRKAACGQKWKDGFKEAMKTFGKALAKSVLLLVPFCCCSNSVARSRQGKVQRNVQMLKQQKVEGVTERELSILAVAVTDLEQRGYSPWSHKHVIQVESRSSCIFQVKEPRTRTSPAIHLSRRTLSTAHASYAWQVYHHQQLEIAFGGGWILKTF